MKNYDVSEKSKGVVIFATNTDAIDYETIAKRSSQLIQYHLGLPTTVICGDASNNFRYSIDNNKFESWNNLGRYQAYELSPYDQTILLDSDYFVLDSSLLKILETVQDYAIVRNNRYVDGQPNMPMGKYSLPHLWATVVAFNRTPKARMLFDTVARVERNYAYYRQLYNISVKNFRNDYAFTIADLMLNGYSQDSSNYIPWPMLSVQNTIDSLELKGNALHLKSAGQAYVLPKQNLHIMSKTWLLSEQCQQFIKDATHA